MDDTTTFVIFGASGDLARRKLIPALFHLYRKRRLPDGFRVVGFARSPGDDRSYRERPAAEIPDAAGHPDAWRAFADRLFYRSGDPARPEDLAALDRALAAEEERRGGAANRLYYLATPPEVYEPAAAGLGQAGMLAPTAGWRRVVIEKPFGRDLASARALNAALHRVLAEEQIYRIDHYLGKETVQNVLFFRFANSIFEPVWNRMYIDHVQITVAEALGVEGRGRFYDSVGVLRDMFQNHLLQLLALVAMEPPASMEAEALSNERRKLLSAVRPITAAQAASESRRGQYRGYSDEAGVAPGSRTATFAALRLFVDNWRWQGVPFYLRSGKRLAAKSSEIAIEFRAVPHVMFPLPPGEAIRPNGLSLCLQPDEGIHLRFEAKVPDSASALRSVDMDFHYADDFPGQPLPEAYERLLLDALMGDRSLFTRADWIERTWALIDPIVEAWEGPQAPPLEPYAPGSWGPAGAAALLARDGRSWTLGCRDHP